jgi:hypothetical protein
MNEILQQKNPSLANLVQRWTSKYADRSFDLTSVKDQADFYEGVLEMARHMASASSTGQLQLNVGPSGPNGLKLLVTPLE